MANTPFQDFLNILNPKKDDPEQVPMDLQGEQLQPGGYEQESEESQYDKWLKQLDGNDVYPTDINQQRALESSQPQEVVQEDKRDELLKVIEDRKKNEKLTKATSDLAKMAAKNAENPYNETKGEQVQDVLDEVNKTLNPVQEPMKVKDLDLKIQGINEPKSNANVDQEILDENDRIIKDLESRKGAPQEVEPKTKISSLEDLYKQYIDLQSKEDPNLKQAQMFDAVGSIANTLGNIGEKYRVRRINEQVGSDLKPTLEKYTPTMSKLAQEQSQSKLKRLQDLISLRQKMTPKETINKPIKVGLDLVERDPKTGEYKKVFSGETKGNNTQTIKVGDTVKLINKETGETIQDYKNEVNKQRLANTEEAKILQDQTMSMLDSLNIYYDKDSLRKLDADTLNSKNFQYSLRKAKGNLDHERETRQNDKYKWQKKEKEELNTKEVQEMTGFGDILKRLDDIESAKKGINTGVYTSGIQRAREYLDGTPANFVKLDTLSGQNLFEYIKKTSGVQFSDKERAAMESLMPNVTQDDEKFNENLKTVRNIMQNKFKNFTTALGQGKDDAWEVYSKLKDSKIVKKEIEKSLKNQKQAPSDNNTEDKITVTKDGKSYRLPKKQLESALKQGYELVK